MTSSSISSTRVWIIMGVSGCGKTTVGEILALCLGGRFIDADKLHPPENVAKMASKIPLTDEDRLPWLERVRRETIDGTTPGSTTVLACSALKRRYRNILVQGTKGVKVIYLAGTFELISERLAARQGHFMPPDLLRSQFETLEKPSDDEGVWTIDIGPTPVEIVDKIMRQING